MKIFKKTEVMIEEKEILRLFGYKDIQPDEEIYELVREEIKQCHHYIHPRIYYKKINIEQIDEQSILLENSISFNNKFIIKKLKNCTYVIVTITTLGEDISSEQKKAFDNGDYIRGMIIDHIGVAAINDINKTFWTELVDDIKGTMFGITSRLSPGDTEWEMQEQQKIFNCMDADFTDVTLTPSYLMYPVKSTSAIYGFGENIGIARLDHICSECHLKHCAYRMDEKATLTLIIGRSKHVIDVKPGTHLFQILRENEIVIASPCQGTSRCGKCKVRVTRGIPHSTANDEKFLSIEEIEQGFRLACHMTVDCNMDIIIEEDKGKIAVLTESKERGYRVDAAISKMFIQMDKPSLEDPRDDDKRLSDACNLTHLSVDIQNLANMSEVMRASSFHNTVTLYGNQLLNIQEGDCREENFGIAIDIGTTTIAAYLINLNNGKQIAVESRQNKQRTFGADVISRINFIIENKDGLKILQRSIVEQINDMIQVMSHNASIRIQDIYDISIVGNTTMIHLLLGLPCKQMALAPYTAVVTRSLSLRSQDIGLITRGIVSFVPCISSYIGSDITAGILSSGMLDSERYSLLLDLGTNGEMALGNQHEIIVCSTATGPAFEGASIKYGIGGVKGAISKIDLSRSPIYETIENEEPCGICGSGVLDAVAQLAQYGIIDETGRMASQDEVLDEYKHRLIDHRPIKEFVLYKHEQIDKMITFTQQDVREVQLAKAAIYAGIKILLKEKKISFDQIEKMYVGGGFGNFMNHDSAVAIGMIPRELADRIESVGNCAGSGAQMYLCSKELRATAESIIDKVEYIELARAIDFQDYFVDAMMIEA